MVMVFNATFNNISVISWRWVLLMEGTGENNQLSLVTDKLYHIMFYRRHLAWAGFELTTSVVICNDCIGSYKSNYHFITTTALRVVRCKSKYWLTWNQDNVSEWCNISVLGLFQWAITAKIQHNMLFKWKPYRSITI